MIWQLRVWVSWDKNSLNWTITQIKTEFKKAWVDIEKNLNSWAEKWLKKIWDESKKTVNSIAWLNNKLDLLRNKLKFADIWSKEFKKIQSEVKNTEKELNSLTEKGSSWFFKLTKAFAWFYAWVKSLSFFWNSHSMAIEERSQYERLYQLLNNVNGSTREQVAILNEQANALEKVWVATAWNITQIQSQLATFDMSIEAIEKLTPSILDYVVAEKGAKASTEDYKSATNSLAQALNGNFQSLTAVWFVLDDATKKQISNGTEMERTKAIVEVLNSTYRWFNKTVAQTDEWKVINLKNRYSMLKTELGEKLIPVVLKLGDLLLKLIDITKEYSKQIWFLIIALATLIWAKWLFWLFTIITKLIPAIKSLTIINWLLTASINLSTVSMRAFTIAALPMLWTLALITTALWWAKKAYDAYASALELIDATNTAQKSQDAMYKVIDKWVQKRKENIEDLKKQNEELAKTEDESAKKQIDINNKKIEANQKFLKANLALQAWDASSLTDEQRNDLNKEWVLLLKEAQKEQDKLWNIQVKTWEKAVVTLWSLNALLKWMQDNLENTAVWTDEFKKLKEDIDKTEKEIKNLTWTSDSSTGKQKENTKELKDQVSDLKDEYNDYEKLIKKLDDSQGKYFENAIKYQDELDDWIRKINNSLKDQESQYKTNIGLIEKERAKKLWETNDDSQQKIAERMLEIEKTKKDISDKFKELERNWVNVSQAVSIWESTLANIWTWTIWNSSVEDLLKAVQFQNQLNDLEKEYTQAQSIVEQKTLEQVRNYNQATELWKILLDQKKQEAEINSEQDNKAKESLEKYEADKKALQDYQRIYEAFQNEKKLTNEQLEQTLADERFQKLSQEEQDLIMKLAKEKISLTEQKDYIKWLDQEVNQARIDLSQSTTELLKADVVSLWSEYTKLITQINSAITAQRQLNSLRWSWSTWNNLTQWFADGWYTGDGWKYEPAWIVHKWEYVVPQSVISQIPSIVPGLEKLRQWWSISNDYSRKIDVWAVTVQNQLDLELFFDKLKFKL